MATTIARRDREAAAHTDAAQYIGSRSYRMASDSARTVHATHGRDGATYCGAAAPVATYGEAARLPLCIPCQKAVLAEAATDPDNDVTDAAVS